MKCDSCGNNFPDEDATEIKDDADVFNLCPECFTIWQELQD